LICKVGLKILHKFCQNFSITLTYKKDFNIYRKIQGHNPGLQIESVKKIFAN